MVGVGSVVLVAAADLDWLETVACLGRMLKVRDLLGMPDYRREGFLLVLRVS